MIMGLIAGTGIGLATVIGSVGGFFVKRFSHRLSDTIMGFAAGVMLAASFIGLLIPSMEGNIWLVISGLIAGGIMISVADKLVPHLHGMVGHVHDESRGSGLDKVILFVLAIALHNLPEGMAVGISFAGDNVKNGLMMSIGIAIQNLPEGIAVTFPLLAAGVSRPRAFIIALATGLIEMSGTILGIALGFISQALLPFLLAFAAGAMIYVISDEIIPGTHDNGNERMATFSLMAGIAVIVFLTMILG